MKIEMGESLFLSWLRHVKQCQVVQLNWKPSTSWDIANENKIADLIRIYRAFIESKYHRELFGEKTGQSLNQIIRQSEIDVLGFKLSGSEISSAYAIDVAFHEGGLIYGTTESTVCRVVKKLVRTAMIMLGYFNVENVEIIFASPNISPKLFFTLKDIINEVSDVANSNNLKYKFRLLGNEDFMEKVIEPVISLSNEIADTSELFMRSFQLYNLCKPSIRTLSTPTATNEIKIGQLVKTTFKNLFSQNIISDDEINRLMDSNYSKKTFGLSFPVLRAIKKISIHQQKNDINEYSRYWNEEFDNGRYLICSQWYERSRKKFMNWLSQFKE